MHDTTACTTSTDNLDREPAPAVLPVEVVERLQRIEDSIASTERALKLVLDVITQLAVNYRPLRKAIESAVSRTDL